MFKKGRILFFVFIFMMLFNVVSVDAITLDTGRHICYKRSNGVITSSCSYYTIYKTFEINGKDVEAFCSQLNKSITNHSYSKSSDFDSRSKDALVAGKSIELVYSDNDYDSDEKYLYTTEIINYIFDYNGSEDYVSDNSSLKSIYNNAVKAVNTYKFSGNDASKLPAITLKSASSNNMNSTSTTGIYLSNKITLGNLIDNFGGGSGSNNGDTSYKISVSVNTGDAYICDKQAYSSSCNKNSVTISKPSAKTKDFYVVVKNGKGGEDVTINVTGTNKSTYPTVTRYESNSGSQKLMVKGSINFSRKITTSLKLSIPDDEKHTIKVLKVDDEGNELAGADLVLYKAALNDDSNKQVGADLKTNSGAASLTYTVTKSSDNDDFFNWKYCVKENKSPDGFVLGNSNITCYTPTKGNSTSCLDSNGDPAADSNYCGAHYTCDGVGDGYELNGGKCNKDNSTPAIVNLFCPNGDVINDENDSHNGKCPPTEVSVVVDELGNPVLDDNGAKTCPEGSELAIVDDTTKCYVYSNPNEKPYCPSGVDPVNGQCPNTVQVDAKCIGGNGGTDLKYCESTDQYMYVVQKGGNLTFTKSNTKTSVSISKRDITGEKEVPGAKLKICSNKPDKDGKCDAVKLTQKGLSCPTTSDVVDVTSSNVFNCITVNDNERTISLEWYSSDVPRSWQGLKTGKYYLIEETPPSGYISTTTATEFEIDSNGAVKTGETTVKDGLLVIKNKLSEMTISKADMATSKEVPGATLSICEAYDDENGKVKMAVDDFGECTVATLADGSPATWVSGNEPHIVVGLPIGKYYLVEKIAPKDYDTAESIVFTMRSDGKVGDANGKLLDGNKLVMFDKSLKQVPTGDIIGWIVLAVVLAVGSCVGVILYRKKKLSM